MDYEMTPEQIAEAIAGEYGSVTAEQRRILDGVASDSVLLGAWANNPIPLAAVRSLFPIVAGWIAAGIRPTA
jgi:hypothetical protein